MSEVLLFAKPGCPHCAAAREDLKRRRVAYREFNVREDQAALLRMLELNGGRRHVPTIVQDGRATVGFDGF